MAVSVVSSSTAVSSSNGTVMTVNAPAGIQRNDVLIAHIAPYYSSVTPPAGWILVSSYAYGGTYGSIFRHTCLGTEPANYTFTASGSGNWAAGVIAIRGADYADPIDTYLANQENGSTAATGPSIITTVVGDMLLWLEGAQTGSPGTGVITSTPPSGMTEQYDVQSSQVVTFRNQISLATQVLGAAGATGTRVGTLSASSQNVAYLLAIKPEPTNTTRTFTSASQQVEFVVPTGVSSLTCDVQGGQGYETTYGGKGGRVQATLSVTPGEIIEVRVGQFGSNGTFVGGGAGGSYGGNGGGASDLRQGGSALANRKLVAGGGGGTGYSSTTGGHGGGLTGQAGGNGNYTGGGGGTQSAGGAAGTGYSVGGQAGSLGQGGASSGVNYTAGGGGGYYGGGGGGDYYCDYYGCSASSGGGGGSNYAGSGTSSVTHTQGYKTGDGLIVITWTAAPPSRSHQMMM